MAQVDLLNLKPTTISRDLKGKFILLYGEPKSGKTSMASLFPRNLLLATEVGYHALPNIYAQDIDSWATFKTVLRQLKDDQVKAQFDTITIDTISLLSDLCEKFICSREGIKTLGDIPYGGGYALFTKEMNETLRELSLLGYGIVFICHSERGVRKHPVTGDDIEFVRPALNKRTYAIVNRLVDIIGYIDVKFDGEDKSVRTLQTRETPYVFAGSRFRFLAPNFPFGYKELANQLHDAIESEGKLGAVIVDSPDVKESTFERPFYMTMNEAKDIWTKLIEQDPDNIDKMGAITERIFGRPTKLSTVSETQQELLELAVIELKSLLKTAD